MSGKMVQIKKLPLLTEYISEHLVTLLFNEIELLLEFKNESAIDVGQIAYDLTQSTMELHLIEVNDAIEFSEALKQMLVIMKDYHVTDESQVYRDCNGIPFIVVQDNTAITL